MTIENILFYFLLLFFKLFTTLSSPIIENYHDLSDTLNSDLNKNNPLFQISFLKTRKSGTTNFNVILGAWLKDFNCFPTNTSTILMANLERGINNGKLNYPPAKYDPIRCPNINFRADEGMCWNKAKIQAIPPRGYRYNATLSLFTVLRDPIGRIGSQAFYSREVVGVKTIIQFISKLCGKNLIDKLDAYDSYARCKNILMPKNHTLGYQKNYKTKCECIIDSHGKAMVELKLNESLWFNWFKQSGRQPLWTFNLYKKNYYLERLFGGVEQLRYPMNYNDFNISLKCLNEGCNQTTLGFNMFYELSAMSTCTNNDRPSTITTEVLYLGKQLLKTHIDFIIMEKYGEYSTAGAIASILQTNQTMIAKLSSSSHGMAGAFPSTSSYRDIMPKSVVQFLEEENKLDIEFYQYALQLFEERAVAEGWNKMK